MCLCNYYLIIGIIVCTYDPLIMVNKLTLSKLVAHKKKTVMMLHAMTFL